METIYAVDNGEEYEDYRVVACFTTPEKQTAFLAKYRELEKDAGLTNLPLDPEPPRTVHVTRVNIARDGSATAKVTTRYTWSSKIAGFWGYDKNHMRYSVLTDNEADAIHFVRRIVKQIVDRGMWGDEEATRAAIENGEIL